MYLQQNSRRTQVNMLYVGHQRNLFFSFQIIPMPFHLHEVT
jgi:hypothetical protein